MPSSRAEAEVVRLAREAGVRYVRLVFVDILGVTKSVTIPVRELEAALAGAMTFDGGSIDGFVRGEEVDMILRPDPSTFAIYPWTVGQATEARLICDIATPDGEPFEGCPRSTLRRALEDARDVLPQIALGVETEFYLFEPGAGDALPPRTSDTGSYFDRSEIDRGEAARLEMVTVLEAMGVAVTSAHHEHGAGQHEIDLRETDPLRAADAFLTTRTIAKHVASRHGLLATFMPKPLEGVAGSGLHLYVETGATAEPDDADDALPQETLFAIGGLLTHAPGFTAICNPTVNSYKRLVAAWDAPIYTVWSHRSANSLVRVPPRRNRSVRFEIRSADSSCNPYLAFSVLVASIAHGLRNHLLPGDPFVGSTYEISERQRSERRIVTLPRSLRQALDELDADPILRGALGDHVYHAFRDAKFAEYDRYRRAVHPWEHEAYLRIF